MSLTGHPDWLRWVDEDAWWLVLAHVVPMLDPLCQFAGGSACVTWPVLAGGRAWGFCGPCGLCSCVRIDSLIDGRVEAVKDLAAN